MREQPIIRVGIVKAKNITFVADGKQHLICIDENGKTTLDGTETTIESCQWGNAYSTDKFRIEDVVIGVGFHWERKEVQEFEGALSFVVEDGKLWAVNSIAIERYLYSVIGSEMKATSNPELLKAHAIISRSWLMAQIEGKGKSKYRNPNPTGYIKIYDRDDHTLFDVCADDHCQRYQGVLRITNKSVAKAIEATAGTILKYTDIATGKTQICDTRFSKCCGGVSELFETCWQDEPHQYLQSVTCLQTWPKGYERDLTQEQNAEKWIMGEPDAFCNTHDSSILKQVLNNYDEQTTPDFYRWKVEYTQKEISDLAEQKSHLGLGTIEELNPIKRGPSGRIYELEIVGSNRTVVIGKELEIRRTLSPSHLYSSAFTVTKETSGQETRFILNGAGWGHGVGLCQIGAAVMSTRGFGYKAILLHYFRCATLEKLWN